MGTRSTTKIYNDDMLILSLYKQYDGYVEGWGKELKDFIKSGTFVNGISSNETRKIFNGIGDFALQLVCEFKTNVGGLYATNEDDEQEYNYTIRYKYGKGIDNDKIEIKCLEDSSFNEVILLEKIRFD